MSKVWHIYMIKTRQDTLYTGVTTDVERRFNEHQSTTKGARYLRGKAPLVLVWHEAVANKQLAMQLEYRIKRLSRSMKNRIVSGQSGIRQLFPDQFSLHADSPVIEPNGHKRICE